MPHAVALWVSHIVYRIAVKGSGVCMCGRACQCNDISEQLQPTSSQIMYVYNIAMYAAFVYMEQQCAVG